MKTPRTTAFEYWYGLVAIASFTLFLVADLLHFKLAFAWTGLAFLLVSGAYLFQTPRIFGKTGTGRLPVSASIVLWPFLLCSQLYNALARHRDSSPAVQEIIPGLFLARRLLPSDIEHLEKLGIKAVLDVTSEFNALQWSVSDSELTYLNVPVLDHQAPGKADIIKAINWLDRHLNRSQSVVVHCALGRGRSVLIVAAYLLASDRSKSVREVLESISSIRETARLNMQQLRTLEEVNREENFRLNPSAWIIANPVSGGGKWPQYESEVLSQLELFYSLTVVTTSPEVEANDLAKQACEAGATLLIAAGGDGTVNGVASVAIKYDVPIAIIPVGTANALCHSLFGFSSKMSPVDKACQIIISGKIKAIDVGYCNDELFTLLTGIGFESRMIELAGRENKNDDGQLAYIKGFLKAVSENKPLKLEVQLDNEPKCILQVTSLVVANAAPVSTLLAQGGGEPDSRDGQLDVTWLDATDSAKAQFVNILDLLAATVVEPDNPGVVHKHCKRIQITAKQTIDYAIDGELRSAEHLNIKIDTNALKVIGVE